MKKIYMTLIAIISGLWTISSIEQESEQLIIPKNKKKYVSKEQCVESKISSVMLINECNRSINALREIADTIQKEDFDMLNDYADGEKNCFFKQADKVELTRYHEKEMKKKEKIEHCCHQLQKMQHELHSLHLEMKKIQKETE